MAAYYNEIDPQAAQWLRNLIAAGHIAPGEVDDRSILDVAPSDLVGFDQCHFFAGVGVWSESLRRAGWPDSRPVWTGSCPCQPFSDAGAGRGFEDERHLWPAFFRLIRERRPGVIFGEQVASKDALAWLDHVQADLEGEGYAVGPLDLCAAGFGAPHIRQRLFFVADSDGWIARHGDVQPGGEYRQLAADGGTGRMADAPSCGSGAGSCDSEPAAERRVFAANDGDVGDAAGGGCGERRGEDFARGGGHADGPGATNGFWRTADWIACTDGKARPVEPGTTPLVNGTPARLVRLRAYGNAIAAPVAEEFIRAYMSI